MYLCVCVKETEIDGQRDNERGRLDRSRGRDRYTENYETYIHCSTISAI